MYVMLYGCARFFTEYFRTPDYEKSLFGITLSAGQLLSVPMILVGALLLFLAYKNTWKVATHGKHQR
jgi:phosphatidylglycerol:prolipoprotein diacylglycerol transferase